MTGRGGRRRFEGGGGSTPPVLVGYDGTPPSRAAVRWALARAAERQRVVVAHAIPLPSRAGLDSFDELLRREREAGADLLGELAQELGPGPELRLLVGEPAGALVECAHGLGASEVVIGSRGHAAPGVSSGGSVCRALLHRSDVPVVAVAPSATMAIGPEFAIRTVLVVDDPETPQGVVGTPAGRLAETAGAKVAVLPLAAEDPSPGPQKGLASARVRGDLLANIIRRAAADIEVETIAPPARDLNGVGRVARTRGAELMVVGATNDETRAGGCTVAKLLEAPPCAIMVVPLPAGQRHVEQNRGRLTTGRALRANAR
jgi:nucleotide-binding universal stress UspA family protein